MMKNHTIRKTMVIAICLYFGIQAYSQCPTPILTYNSANTLCDDAPLELTASITLPPGCAISSFNGYNWNGPGLAGTSGSSNMQPVTPSADAGDYSVRIQLEDDATTTVCPCIGFTEFSNLVTVNPTAEAPSVVDQFVCEGATATFTAVPEDAAIGGDFYWYSDAALTNLVYVGNPYTTPNVFTNTSFYVTEVALGCESVAEEAVVSSLMQNSPVVTPGNPINICIGDNTTLTANSAIGNTISGDFYWYSDALGNNLLYTGKVYTTPSLSANTSYWVREIDGDCATELTQVDVTPTLLPAPAVAPLNPSICEGNEVVLTASGGTGDFQWFSDAAGSNLIFTGNPYTTPNLNTSTDYWVREVDGLCESDLTLITITTDVVIVLPTVADVTICENEQATMTVTNGNAGDIFEWYDNNTASNLLFTGSSFQTPSLSTTTSYWVRRNEGNCNSDLEEVVVTVNANPEPPVTVGDNLCPNVQANLSASGTGDLNWYDEAVGGTLLFTGSNFVTPNPLFQTTYFYVEAEDPITGCVSERVVTEATVLPAVTPPSAPSNVPVCFGETTTLSATGSGIAGNEIRWYLMANGGTPISVSTMLPATGTFTTPPIFVNTNYYVAEYDVASDCESNRTFVRIEANDEIPVPTVVDAIACEGDIVTVTGVFGAGSNQGAIQWYDALVGGNLLYIGENFTVPQNLIPTSGIYNFYLEEAYNGCSSARETLTVEITANPTLSNADVTGDNICEQTTAMLSAVSTTTGSDLNWYDDATGTNLLFTGSSFETPILTQTTTFWVQELNTSTGCVSEYIPVTAQVSQLPTLPTAVDVSICEGEDVLITASGSGTGTLNWYDDTGALVYTETMTPGDEDGTYNAGVLNSGTHTFFVEENDGTCTSEQTPVTVVVADEIPQPTVVDAIACEGDEVILTGIFGAGSNQGAIQWYDGLVGGNLLYIGENFTVPQNLIPTSGIYNFYLEEAYNGCSSTRETVTVEITSNPTLSNADVIGDNICEQTTAMLSAVSTTTGSDLNWYDDATGTNLLFTGSGFETPILTQTTTFWVQELNTSTGCVSEYIPVTAQVSQLPTLPTAVDVSICEGEDVLITASGSGTGTLNWYDDTGALVYTETMTPGDEDGTYNAGVLNSGTHTFFVEENDGTCTSEHTPVTVVVADEIPQPTVVDAIACEGDEVILTGIFGAGSNQGAIQWYDALVGGNLLYIGENFTVPQNLIPSSGIYNFYLEEAYNGCSSTRETVTVEITANPTLSNADVTGDNICEQTTAMLSAVSTTTGSDLNWYDDATGTNLLFTGPSFETPILTQTTTFWVQELNTLTGCVSEYIPVTAQVSQLPTLPTAVDVSICEGEDVLITASGSGTGTLNWYDDTGALVYTETMTPGDEDGTYNAGVLNSGTHTFFVEENDGTCTSEQTPVTVVVADEIPQPTVVDAIACEGDEVILTGIFGAGSNQGAIQWYDGLVGGNLLYIGENFTIPQNLIPSSGIYNFYLEEAYNGCSSTRETVTVEITSNPTLSNADVTGDNICEQTTAMLSAVSTTTGSDLNWYDDATGTNLLFTGSGFETPILTQTTTFWVQELNTSTGCVSEYIPVTAQVSQLPTLPTAVDVSICEGEDVLITASGSGTGTLNWYDDTGALVYTETMTPGDEDGTYNAGVLNSGTHTFFVEENDGTCTSEQTPVTVVVADEIPQPTVIDAIACEGDEVILTGIFGAGSNQGAIQWYDGLVGGNLLYIGENFTIPQNLIPSSGIYNFYLEEAYNGCSSTRETVTVEITSNPTLSNADVTGDNICEQTTAMLSAVSTTTGSDLNWYDDATGTNLLFTGPSFETWVLVQTTTFWVQELNTTTGCVSEFIPVTAIVSETSVLLPTAVDVTLCEGEDVLITASGSGNGSLNWYDDTGALVYTETMTPGEEDGTYNAGQLAPGNHTFFVAESNGVCASENSPVTVSVIPLPVAPFVNDTMICEGESIALNAPGVGTFHWYDDIASGNLLYTGLVFNTPSLSATTSYFITAEVNGCESVREEIIVSVEMNPPLPMITGSSGICEGDTLQLETTATGVTYAWTGPNGFNSPLQNPSIVNAQESDNQGQYTLIVTSLTGCSSEAASIWIDIHPTPQTPTLLNSGPLCEGEDLILTTNTIADANYTWTGPDGVLGTTTTSTYTIPAITLLEAGDYEVFAEVNGCPSPVGTTIVEVRPIPEPPIVTNTGPVCIGSDLIIEVEAVLDGHYYWTGPNGFTSTDQVINIFGVGNDDEGNYTVEITVGGCTSIPGTTFVQIDSFPEIIAPTSVFNNGPICEGDTLYFSSPLINGVSYEWTGPNGIILNGHEPFIAGVIESDHQGVYTMIMTDSITGCISQEFISLVEINPTLEWFQADNNGPNCEGFDIQLFTSDVVGATYSWTGPNGFTSTEQNPILTAVTLDDAGDYEVIVISDSACVAFSVGYTEVIVDPKPTANAGPDQTIEEGRSTILDGSGGITYEWSPSIGLDNPYLPNPISMPPLDTIVYHLIVYNGFQCSDTDSMTLYVKPQLILGHVDNGIAAVVTPNGDGVNDTWVLEYIQNIDNYEIFVLDRGGSNVFYSNNYLNDWDCTYRDKKLPDGVYWYIIKTPQQEYNGAILVKR